MSSYIEFLMQIIVCFLLSACIGIERQYRRRSVGLLLPKLVYAESDNTKNKIFSFFILFSYNQS